jgi:predicted nucleotidyltransferase
MNGHIEDMLRRLRSELTKIYGERLKGVYLFGSHAGTCQQL